MTLRVVVHEDAERNLKKSEDVGKALRTVAEKVKKKVRARKGLALSVRAGVSRRGAFSQVIMRGQGAVAEEFGTHSHPAKAPLRTALRSGLK
jgi:hypothetical protein